LRPPEPSPSRQAHKTPLRVVTARAFEVAPNAYDARDLNAIYRRFAPYVAAVGVRILGRSDELDDLVQDVFIAAARGIAKLSEPEAIKAWLARIAVRSAVRRLRQRRLLRALYLASDTPLDTDTLVAPDASPEQRALVAHVYRVLDDLSAADRAAWVLRYVEGETLEQAAELCGCSLSTYQRRLRRAAEHLEKELPDG
jgi:RNA polymerase sigma-70 factor (ECF subfamily)